MTKKKIGIIGMGYVGSAFYELVKDHYDIVSYDPAKNKVYPKKQLALCALVAICVPTPSHPDGSCNTTIVESAIAKVPNDNLLIKSTISPGTTQSLAIKYNKHIAFSPEYISESTYNNPYYKTMRSMPYVVVGGEGTIRNLVISLLETIYGPTTTYYQCSATEAEFIKYMANTYSALKVTFVNEMYDAINAYGANWHTVREGWLLDDRVERMSTSVFAHKRGYDGKCLPKDSKALIKAFHAVGLEPKLLQGMHEANERHITLNYVADKIKQEKSLDIKAGFTNNNLLSELADDFFFSNTLINARV